MQPRKTLSDRLELEKSLPKSANPVFFSISKHSFCKITRSANAHVQGYKWGRHTQR